MLIGWLPCFEEGEEATAEYLKTASRDMTPWAPGMKVVKVRSDKEGGEGRMSISDVTSSKQ